MAGMHVHSSWMICTDFFLHSALNLLEMESGMMLTDASESTKQLWTLQLKILNESKNGGQIDFVSSIQSVLSTIVSELGDFLAPLMVEVVLSVDFFPNACIRISHWPLSLANSNKDMFAWFSSYLPQYCSQGQVNSLRCPRLYLCLYCLAECSEVYYSWMYSCI